MQATPNQIKERLFQAYTSAWDNEKEYGHTWYQTAHNECQRLATLYNAPLSTVCGVVAALSPRCHWEQNIKLAEVALAYGTAAKCTPCLKMCKDKANRILQGEHPLTVLNGPKTRAFYDNLLCPDCSQTVTVDTWIARAAIDPKHDGRIKPREYDTIAQAIVDISTWAECLPHQVQAVIWIYIKKQQLFQPRLF